MATLTAAPIKNAPSNGKTENGVKATVSGKIKTYPAHPRLATPTDLKHDAVQKVVDAVNPLIADSFALYVKTKNFHWHLSGSHFRGYHLMLDEQADVILASIDPLAERLRKIGGTTIRSISHISQAQTIPDDNDEYVPPREIILRLLADNQHMAAAQRKAIDLTEDQGDSPTSNLLQEILDETERRIWFLFETAQGLDEQD